MAFLEEYTLLDELGQGGFATVYKVRHNSLRYIRAIRVLNATIAHGESDKTYQKFLEECKLLLRLGNGNHPHIVHIYQPLLRAQKAIVEMDFVDGKDLFHYLQEKSSFVEIEDVMKLLTDIGSALAYCHEDIYKFCMDKDEDNLMDDPNDGSKVLLDDETRKRLIQKYRVIHNDIHSGNIIRRDDGNFVLLDFGLAIEGDTVVRSSRKKNGAPEFKAPEKWENEGILTTRSDIYSFGVVLYEFLAGRVPFMFDKKNSNTTEAEYLLSKAHKEALPEPIFGLRKMAFERSHPNEIYKKDYPDWLEKLIMKCLAKDPNDRFGDGKELFTYAQGHLSANNDYRVVQLEEENAKLRHIIQSTPISGVDTDAPLREFGPQIDKQGKTQSTSSDHSQEVNAQAKQLDDLKKQLERSKTDFDMIYKKLSVSNHDRDRLQKENQELKSQRNTTGNRIWKRVSLVIIPLLLATIAYLAFNAYPGNSNNNPIIEGLSNIELAEQEKIIYTINNYYKSLTEQRYSELTSLYSDQIQRYYNTTDVTPNQIIQDLESYDQKLGIVSKNVYVDWNTLDITKNGDNTSLSYNIAYVINTASKSSVYQLKMHVDIDQQYRIYSIYEENLQDVNNSSDANLATSNSTDQALINNLKQQIQSLNAEISNLKSSQQQTAGYNARTERDDKNIAKLQAQIDELNNTINQKNQEINALQNELFK